MNPAMGKKVNLFYLESSESQQKLSNRPSFAIIKFETSFMYIYQPPRAWDKFRSGAELVQLPAFQCNEMPTNW